MASRDGASGHDGAALVTASHGAGSGAVGGGRHAGIVDADDVDDGDGERVEGLEEIEALNKRDEASRRRAAAAAAAAADAAAAARVRVICLYKAQCDAIPGSATIDAVQGSTADIVILSTVRCRRIPTLSSHSESFARALVAVSRARRHLIVVGDVAAMAGSVVWGAVCGGAPKVAWSTVGPRCVSVDEFATAVASSMKF
jgi:hypothetical protein